MRRDRPDRQPERPDDDLLAALRAALRPEPLPTTLSGRIRADLDRRCVPARRPGLPRIHVIWLAAAACLLVAVLLPLRLTSQHSGKVGQRESLPSPSSLASPSSDTFAPVSLTSDEAAEIVAAYVALSWESPLDYMLDAVDASLDGIERVLQREAGSTTLLPWSNDDDWDVPAVTDENQSQSRAPDGALCFAGSTCRYRG